MNLSQFLFPILYKSKCFCRDDSTLEGLRKKERELLNRLNSQLSVSSKKKTLNDEYELWKRLKTGVKGSTFSNYVYMYEHYVLKSKLGASFLRLITKSDVKAFYLNLLKTTTLKVNTLSNIQGVVYQVLEMAKDDRIIVSNPADGALTEIRRSYEDESEGRIALEWGLFFVGLDFQKEKSYHKNVKYELVRGWRL